MKILIAEDQNVPRLVLEMGLKKLGHNVVATVNGEEAWQAFRQDDFPIMITDWQMPLLDGPELCRLVRAEPRPRYTYIVMATAFDTRPDYRMAIEAGIDDFLNKPFDIETLAARLHVAERIGGLLSTLQQLNALLPICPTCKSIRDEHDQWIQVEKYIATHVQAVVGQRQCPRCEATRPKSRQNSRARLDQVSNAIHAIT